MEEFELPKTRGTASPIGVGGVTNQAGDTSHFSP